MDAVLYEKISEADLILVGLGEEFNIPQNTERRKKYQKYREILLESGKGWMLPELISFLSEEEACHNEKDSESEAVCKGLCRLAELLQNKNYFVVSVSVNDKISQVPWKEGRLVAPCGTGYRKQCENGCASVLKECSQEEKAGIRNFIRNLESTPFHEEEAAFLGICPECGKPMVLNNIYAEHYNENGYLGQWNLYTKWLQGTLNKKILLLELGVGMQFPSVIRWPFEKIAFFQKKAEFYRINEKLYHMSEELKGKGNSIAMNAVEWLGTL